MGFYSQRVFPYLMDWSMASPELAQYRRSLLANVTGTVLEIGFGTGLNLAYYPENVRQLVAIDANAGSHRLAEKRVAQSGITVDHRVLNGERLPMSDETFDSVVSTWTLCSIANVEQAIAEIHRVLKPGGKFFFVEHGLSRDPNVQVWQNRLNPVQKVIADGCHLNRNIRQLVEQQFSSVAIEEFYGEGLPKFLGYLYKGTASKPGQESL
ncbi:class I SAM-dependent methyltransferase [Leptolyngbya ohadii]|uniref:class I SAM-dependent methyltransferase n=1 Tax=Leptolyngbya ohadii TaxID=1962290 RepID=UPI000B5A0381|nr:class I SAM-dependent methyltransferase [Leptolyngbya ohadii]